jgi:hypothetical protein
MELIAYYLLFAFSTAITASIFFFSPLIREARQSNVENSFTQYPVLSTVVYIFISAIVAPMLVFPLLSDSVAKRFQDGLRREIMKAD